MGGRERESKGTEVKGCVEERPTVRAGRDAGSHWAIEGNSMKRILTRFRQELREAKRDRATP